MGDDVNLLCERSRCHDANDSIVRSSGSFSHLDIWPKQELCLPLHLWLTLPETEAAGACWEPQHAGRLAAAALLEVTRMTKRINVKACIGRRQGYDHVDKFQVLRQLAAQIGKPLTGPAGQGSN